ncbi:phage tail assembly chaperone [Pseudomonas sp. TWP3-2]|uniref:phage tail assembly chaperone n=1 Tax=Pseudomonas sp. TWP3-2 TaxID=2804574 RepID=UPI003CEBCA14
MQIFMSPTAAGFFHRPGNTNIPEDAVEISADTYASLLSGLSAGLLIGWDDQSVPKLVDPPVPVQDISAHERAWRDGELSSVMWLRERHRDQLEIAVATTLTAEQFNELLVYMQTLRDWPQSPQFPASQERPIAPQWLAGAQEDHQ